MFAMSMTSRFWLKMGAQDFNMDEILDCPQDHHLEQSAQFQNLRILMG